MSQKNYHHGDLHAALIAAGMALLAEGEGDDLSLRELARRVGVSATAVYRHFPDKGALMAALASEGLAMLAADQRVASDRAGGGLAGFGATGAAYVRFALAHPALFRLIFAHPAPAGLSKGALDYTEDAMTMLRANAAMAAPPGSDPQVFALRAWSVAHGLAMLILDGQIKADDAMIDGVVDPKALGAKG